MSLPEMTDIQINALRKAGIEVEVIDEKCWKGYEKKGMKTMFGKRYPNCVKKEEAEVRYCPKCEKNETREECAYGGKYWDENSMPAKDVKEATIEPSQILMEILLQLLKLKPKQK